MNFFFVFISCREEKEEKEKINKIKINKQKKKNLQTPGS